MPPELRTPTHIARSVGLDLPIVPVRHEYFVTVHAEGLQPNLPVVRIPDSTLYLRRDQLLLCGGWEPTRDVDRSAQLSDRQRTAAGLILTGTCLAGSPNNSAPRCRKSRTSASRSVFKGWPTFTPDGRFIVGLTRKSKASYGGGCNAHGVPRSAGIGRHVVESIMDPNPSPYVRSLSPDRFDREPWIGNQRVERAALLLRRITAWDTNGRMLKDEWNAEMDSMLSRRSAGAALRLAIPHLSFSSPRVPKSPRPLVPH